MVEGLPSTPYGPEKGVAIYRLALSTCFDEYLARLEHTIAVISQGSLTLRKFLLVPSIIGWTTTTQIICMNINLSKLPGDRVERFLDAVSLQPLQ